VTDSELCHPGKKTRALRRRTQNVTPIFTRESTVAWHQESSKRAGKRCPSDHWGKKGQVSPTNLRVIVLIVRNGEKVGSRVRVARAISRGLAQPERNTQPCRSWKMHRSTGGGGGGGRDEGVRTSSPRWSFIYKARLGTYEVVMDGTPSEVDCSKCFVFRFGKNGIGEGGGGDAPEQCWQVPESCDHSTGRGRMNKMRKLWQTMKSCVTQGDRKTSGKSQRCSERTCVPETEKVA